MKPGKTIIFRRNVRTVGWQLPKLNSAIHFAKSVFKDVTKLWENLRERIRATNDDDAYFNTTKELQTILKKHSTQTLGTLLDSVNPIFLPPYSSLSRLKDNINSIPQILHSLERKKALILLQIFTLSELQDDSKSKQPSTQLNSTQLNHALDLFKSKEGLIIYGSQAHPNSPIKIEPLNGSSGAPIRLVCLHSNAENRIWGTYNIETGELVFTGIAKSHDVWREIILNFK